MVRVAGAEYLCDLVGLIDDEIAELTQPSDLCHPPSELVGHAVELRWRTVCGVTRADGVLTAIEGTGFWVVHLSGPPQRVDERLYRRVGVQVDVDLAMFVNGRPQTDRTTTRNLSLGGAALVAPPSMPADKPTAVVVAIDPQESRILAGASVVSDCGDAELLRVRFEWISSASQDQLVSLINRSELKLAR